MSAQVRFNNSYRAKKRRIQELPTMMNNIMYGLRKKDAALLISYFHSGIKNEKFSLLRLHPFTVERKEGFGYKLPETPLYGKGDDAKLKAYVNMLRMRKIHNGWKVFGSLGRHHKSNLTLRHLLNIHEAGITIKVTAKMRKFLHRAGLHLKADTTVIRIPPRPAFKMACDKIERTIKNRNDAAKIKKEIATYIKYGRSEWFESLMRTYQSEYGDLIE